MPRDVPLPRRGSSGMKRVAIVLTVGLCGCIAWFLAFPSVTLRYRLTLEAQVDDRTVVGSGVIQVTYEKNAQFLGASAEITHWAKGEAVVLDLGSSGVLFALLKEGDHTRSGADYIVPLAFGLPYGAVGVRDFARLRDLAGRVDLPFDRLPLMVRFRDINDPKTVQRVDPNNLASTFGAGVFLTRVTLELVPAGIWPFHWLWFTGEPISRGLDLRLPWLATWKRRGGTISGQFSFSSVPPPEAILVPKDFQQD